MIKVDHVGENGAVNIYRAQAMVARALIPNIVESLREFQAHEEQHRSIFAAHLRDRGIRRCVSYHAAGVGGFVLGFVTALMGRRAIYATTFAVEHVVLDHLEEQIEYLGSADPAACSCVQQIHDDEQEHHDSAHAEIGEHDRMTRMLIAIVQFCTNSVIRFGMR